MKAIAKHGDLIMFVREGEDIPDNLLDIPEKMRCDVYNTKTNILTKNFCVWCWFRKMFPWEMLSPDEYDYDEITKNAKETIIGGGK